MQTTSHVSTHSFKIKEKLYCEYQKVVWQFDREEIQPEKYVILSLAQLLDFLPW